MATTFDSHFASAGFPLLLQQFGESIVYIKDSGARRAMQAIVERDPPAVFDAAGNAVLPKLSIRVYNSCRSGIRSSEVDIGVDEIEALLRIGETEPKTFSFMTLVSQDAGVCHFALI